MKETKVNDFINVRPESLMIICKEVIEKECYEYVCKQQYNQDYIPMNLTEEERNNLINLSKINVKEFIDNLIQHHLKGETITSIYEGSNYLLPSRFRQFYEKCITISTENYQLYFNDLAILKFRDTILKLNERSKTDSLNFVRGKLETEKVYNMHLSLDKGFSFRKGRGVRFVEDDHIYIGPLNTIYYSAPISKKGNVDIDDINNIITLIEEFTKHKGLIKFANYNSDEMVIYYNNGSLKIAGMSKNSDMKERVHKKVNQLFRK